MSSQIPGVPDLPKWNATEAVAEGFSTLTRIVATPFGAMVAEPPKFDENMVFVGDDVYRLNNGTVEIYDPYEPSWWERVTQGGGLGGAIAGARTEPDWRPVSNEDVPPSVTAQAKQNAKRVAAVARRMQSRAARGPAKSKLSAAEGGQLNDPEFLGADILAEDYGYTKEEILAYSTDLPKPPRRMAASGTGRESLVRGQYGKFRGSNTQNYYHQLQRKGYGRPQYGPDDVGILTQMAPGTLKGWQLQMQYAGVPGAESMVFGAPGDPATINAFRYVLTQANLAGVPAEKMLTQLVTDKSALDKADDRGLLPGSTGAGTKKFDPVRVREVVNLTGKARARATLREMMANMLGRKPTPGEVQAYVDRLNAAEERDPTVVTTRLQKDGDSKTTTEQSDVDPTQIARREIKGGNPKEYKEYAELNYYNIIADMMGQ